MKLFIARPLSLQVVCFRMWMIIFAILTTVTINAVESSSPHTRHTPVSVVFIAGLEGTGHHAWKQVLRTWCYSSTSRGLCCNVGWEMKKRVLKATHLLQKEFQPKVGCKEMWPGTDSDCSFFDKSKTSATLQSKLRFASTGLSNIVQETRIKCSSTNTCDQRHYLFLNVHTNGTMWSYPDSRGEGGHGWNPEARAIQIMCQMAGLDLKIIWLHRNGPHLIRSNVVHRRFHRQKYAAHTWGAVTFPRKSVKWFGRNDTLALDFYMESLTRSLCLLHTQMRAAFECTKRAGASSGCTDVMLVDYDRLICHADKVAPLIATFLGVSRPAPFVHALQRTVRCSGSASSDDTSVSALQENAFKNLKVKDFLRMSMLTVSDSVTWSKKQYQRIGRNYVCSLV